MYAVFEMLICISFSHHKSPSVKDVNQNIRDILIRFPPLQNLPRASY